LHGDDVPARVKHLARRHSELLPFFWSANGITSMSASVLGMALSIEFGIAKTYAPGVCFYVVCVLMIVVCRQANRMGASAARPVKELEVVRRDEVAAPPIHSTQFELAADIDTDKSRGSTRLARTGEAVE
jgi:hypothetical protein